MMRNRAYVLQFSRSSRPCITHPTTPLAELGFLLLQPPTLMKPDFSAADAMREAGPT